MRTLFTLAIIVLLPCLLTAQEKKRVPRMVPDHVKLQYAGGIGFLSVGFGYESPNQKFQGDFYYGNVPAKWGGGRPIHSVTGKLTWLPLSRKLNRDIRLDIINAGILLNYTFGKQYFLFKPTPYPYQYYGFPTALNGVVFLGTGIRYQRFGLYYEVGSSGKDMLSYVKNTKSRAFSDILTMGVGLRYAVK